MCAKNFLLLIFTSMFFILMGCGGGSGGGEGFIPIPEQNIPPNQGIELVSVTFPPSTESLTGPATPPAQAPLLQQIVFTFSGPVLGKVSSSGLQIHIQMTPNMFYSGPEALINKTKNVIESRGSFEVMGHMVVFTPQIPLNEIDLSPDAELKNVPGLLPGFTYTVYVPVNTSGSIKNLVKASSQAGNNVTFTTVQSDLPLFYFSNQPCVAPMVVSTDPSDGFVDFPLNSFSQIPGLPLNRDITLHIDQPLDFSSTNKNGEDQDGDGFADPSFFLGYSDPLLFASIDKTGEKEGCLARINSNTDQFQLLGPTLYNSKNVGLNSLVTKGADSGLTLVGCAKDKLYDIDVASLPQSSGICVLKNEREIQNKEEVFGLCASRDGKVYCIKKKDLSLALVNLDSGELAPLGPLPSGSRDLAMGHDNELFLLRTLGSESKYGVIEKINKKTLQIQVVIPSISGDFTSMDFSAASQITLYDSALKQRVVLSLTSGEIVEYGQTLSNPELIPGAPLNLLHKQYEFAVDVSLKKNTHQGSQVDLKPIGILPDGQWLDLMVRNNLRNVTKGSKVKDDLKDPAGAYCAARFKTFDPGDVVLKDQFFEDFLTNNNENPIHEFANAKALWNVIDVDNTAPHYQGLVASFGLAGNGELGDFSPKASVTEYIVLDTDYQVFPLFSGATPDIKETLVVKGGEFHFKNFTLPEGVTLSAHGNNPLVITATERVEIAGFIDISGQDGTDDVTYNSGFLPVPGGKGGPNGGNGGMGQPPVPKNFIALSALISPPNGERGWGPGNVKQIGGFGGESGAKGTNVSWPAAKSDKWSRGAGAGGGSFLQTGAPGYVGLGDYTVDIFGNYVLRPLWSYWDGSYKFDPSWDPTMGEPPETWKIKKWDNIRHPRPGPPGDLVFSDADENNDFLGANGELRILHGGQGGGGGGSRLDSMNPNTIAQALNNTPVLSRSAYDAKGGGGGGGGGALAIHCIGEIVIRSTGKIDASGGKGGGGEMIGLSNFGGGGGGGSGGAIVLNSGERILIEPDILDETRLDVSGGWGADAKLKVLASATVVDDPCEIIPATGALKFDQHCSFTMGDGGCGGYGLIQLMCPDPTDPSKLSFDPEDLKATICQIDKSPLYPKTQGEKGYSYYHYDLVGEANEVVFPKTLECLIPPEKTLSSISSISFGMSNWINLGYARDRVREGGEKSHAFFGFEGIHEQGPWGVVETTSSGMVVNSHLPLFNDIQVDAPDLYKTNFIPEDNQVAIRFQGADGISLGSKFPNENPDGMTPWTADLSSLTGKRFIRFCVRLNVSLKNEPTSLSPKPQVNYVRMRFQF